MTVHSSERSVPRILIVEDEALLAVDLEESLKDFGYKVVGAVATGDRAVRETLQSEPDLILMDINLPGELDGIEAYSRIREHLDIPVVYLTGYSERDVLERAKRTEPYGYLAKPISLAELRSTLETALYKHEADKRVRESEERLRSILDSLHDFVFVLNMEGVFTDCHIPPNLKSKLYVQPKNFIGRCYKEVLPPDVSRLLDEAVNSLEQTEVPQQFDYQLDLGDRQEWFAARISRRRDIRGRICGVTIVCRDITARKMAEEALLESENMLRSSQSMAHVGSWQLELATNNLIWSDEAYRIFGVQPQEFAATYEAFLEMVHPEDRTSVDTAYSDSLGQGRDVYEIEHRIIRRASGEIRYVHEKCRHLRDSTGRIVRSVGMVQDVTERRKAEDCLRESREKYRRIVHTANEGIIVMDREFRTSFVNPRLADMIGFTVDEIIGKTVDSFMFEEDLPDHWSNMELRIQGRDQCYERRFRKKNGETLWTLISTTCLKDAEGNFDGSFGMLTDITERKKMEKALLERDALISSISNNLQSGMIYQVVRQNDGSRKFTYLSEKVRDYYGCSPEDALNDSGLIYGRVHPEDRHRVLAEEEKAHEALSDFRTEARLINTSGGIRWAYFSSTPERLKDGRTRWNGIEIDITERKKTEEALRESDKRFRDLYDNLRDGVSEVDERGRFLLCNSRHAEMLGYTFEELSELTVEDVTPVRWHAMESQIRQEQIDVRGYSDIYEKEYVDKNGTIFPVQMQAYSAKDLEGNKVGYWAFVRDITDRKKAEEALRKSEQRYRNIFEATADGLLVFDEAGRIVDANPAASRMYGYTKEEFLRLHGHDIVHPDNRSLFDEALQSLMSKRNISVESRDVKKDGTPFSVEIRGSHLEFDERVRLLGIITDISDRKKADDRIRATLKEKEVLLREIHHRVKNNLAVVSSLLRLQSRYTQDETVRAMFEETEDRIRSMALAHAEVYQTESLSAINARKYLGSLLNHLRSSMGRLGGNVSFRSEIEDLNLQIDTAIPLGFIVTELISNVFKHAFPEGRPGELRLLLYAAGDLEYVLVVKDDGVGISDKLDVSNPTSCGLTLVNVFVKQIRGVLEVRAEGGTEVRVIFPKSGNGEPA